ncbi:MAG: hypothetical protein Q8K82_26460, partial [Gemmatimonadaceae bacterium]|nr:hypothetical protein [Gemmatimonadaceae bacterium]
MTHVWTTRRTLGSALVIAGGLVGTFLVRAAASDAMQGKAMVRGNVPGEWRYWGGDAWGTRY